MSIGVLTLVTVALSCHSNPAMREIDVHATDYAFRVPRTVAPGLAAFRLVNDGNVWHEIQLFRFRPTVTAESATRFLAADSIPDEARDSTGGVLIAGAQSATDQRLLTSLTHGELYGLICDFRNAPSQPRHAKLGMFALVRVD